MQADQKQAKELSETRQAKGALEERVAALEATNRALEADKAAQRALLDQKQARSSPCATDTAAVYMLCSDMRVYMFVCCFALGAGNVLWCSLLHATPIAGADRDVSSNTLQKAYDAARSEGEGLAARLQQAIDSSLSERRQRTDAQIAAGQAKSTADLRAAEAARLQAALDERDKATEALRTRLESAVAEAKVCA